MSDFRKELKRKRRARSGRARHSFKGLKCAGCGESLCTNKRGEFFRSKSTWSRGPEREKVTLGGWGGGRKYITESSARKGLLAA